MNKLYNKRVRADSRISSVNIVQPVCFLHDRNETPLYPSPFNSFIEQTSLEAHPNAQLHDVMILSITQRRPHRHAADTFNQSISLSNPSQPSRRVNLLPPLVSKDPLVPR